MTAPSSIESTTTSATAVTTMSTSENRSIMFDDSFSIDNLEIASKNLQLFLTLLYTVTAGLALFGNVISIFVLMRGKRSSRDLRLFLVNLSLSDILMAIFSIPFTYTQFIMGRWLFQPALCPVVQSIQIVSVFVSVYTLTTIGVDRYIAIMKPFIVNFWKESFGPIIVVMTWLLGASLGLVIWFYSRAEPFVLNNVTYYDCHESWSSNEHEQIYTVCLFLVVFALPLILLIYFYGSICYKLWYHCAPGNANVARDVAQYQAKKKVIKMLITIVALFAVCWLPSHLFHLVRVFNKDLLMHFIDNDASNPKYLAIVISSHWLSMAHSFVNPIIYSFMSDNFKADVKYMGKKLMINRKYRYHRNQRIHHHHHPHYHHPHPHSHHLKNHNFHPKQNPDAEYEEEFVCGQIPDIQFISNNHRDADTEEVEEVTKNIEMLMLKSYH